MTDVEFWDEVYRRGVGVAVRTPTGVEIIWPVPVSAETIVGENVVRREGHEQIVSV